MKKVQKKLIKAGYTKSQALAIIQNIKNLKERKEREKA